MTEIDTMTDTLVEELSTESGDDYTPAWDDLRELVESQMDGNWDNTTSFAPELGLRDVRIIQEDEYDQSMDEEDKPEYEFEVSLGYGFFQ